jgi:Rieske Fe-S protein
MERKEFLKTCGFACMSGTVFASILEGCAGSKMIVGTMDQSNLVIPLTAFQLDESNFKKYVVVQNEQLKYPVCVYRLSATEYTALSMRCTHQGAELQVFGERLECPAHGSQFSNTGEVKNGPANSNLRTFATSLKSNQLLISLK